MHNLPLILNDCFLKIPDVFQTYTHLHQTKALQYDYHHKRLAELVLAMGPSLDDH